MQALQTLRPDTDMLEDMRLKADRVADLELKMGELEQQRETLQRTLSQLEGQIAEYHIIKDEWDWFFQHSLDMLVIHDSTGRLSRVSPAVEKILGYTPDEFMGLAIDDIVHPEDMPDTIAHLANIASGTDGINYVSRCRHKDGSWRWMSWTTPAPSRSGRAYALARDVTRSKMTEQELLHRAQHDQLTGLANRAAFDQALEHALARAQRTPERRIALLLMDLDGFKAINDTHGHLAGDVVLKTVAARMRKVQRKSDLVARLGGDEFACLVEDPAPDALDLLAIRLIEAIGEPVDIGDWQVKVGCSIGIATYPNAATDARTLYEHADRAMYEVKTNGKSSYRHHRP